MFFILFVSVMLQTPTAKASACTFTIDANQNVLMGPGCTAADLFKNAAADDFHLVPNSPAIGRAECLAAVPTDFDGVPRPSQAPRPGNTGCDIGAYQFVPAAPPPGPKPISTTVISQ